MSFFSARISIQWPPEPAGEPSTTMVSSTPSGKFVDLRPLRNPQTDEEKRFPFEWAIIGYSEKLSSDKTQFNHSVDSRVEAERLECLKKGKVFEEQPDLPDVGEFSALEDGDRREDGEMMNVASGKIQPYVEIWRTLDGDLTVPDQLVRFADTKDVNETKYLLYELSTQDFQGRYIVIGKWGQGILNRKSFQGVDVLQLDSTMSCIRIFEGKPVICYGIDVEKFPLNSTGDWQLLESN